MAVVWRSAAQRGQADSLDGLVRRRMRALSLLCAAIVIGAAIAELAQAPGGFGTAAGRQLVWRAALAAVIAGSRPWRLPTVLRVAIWGICGAAVLGTFSLTGHAAAMLPAAPGPFLANWLHVAATTVWYGGLVCLYLVTGVALTAREQQALALAVHRFATVGLLTMAAIAASGLLLADRYVYGLAALTEHSYGATMLVKLVFVGGVLALAGLNHWWVQPRLGRAAAAGAPGLAGKAVAGPARALRRLVAGEIVLGFAVLALAVRLAATAPATAEPVRLTVTLAPGPADTIVLEVPPLQPVRLTVRNADAVPRGIYIPQIPGVGDMHGRAGDMQVVVQPGAARAVTFTAPATGQYVIYYVGRDGLYPAGWLLIKAQ